MLPAQERDLSCALAGTMEKAAATCRLVLILGPDCCKAFTWCTSGIQWPQ